MKLKPEQLESRYLMASIECTCRDKHAESEFEVVSYHREKSDRDFDASLLQPVIKATTICTARLGENGDVQCKFTPNTWLENRALDISDALKSIFDTA